MAPHEKTERRGMTSPTITTSAANAITAANAAIAADDRDLQAQWDAAPTPFIAWANRSSPEVRARRAKLFAALDAARGVATGQRENRVLNSAGKPQATLARATTNQIKIDPAKTVEQIAAAAVRSSQINRPAKASKKVAA